MTHVIRRTFVSCRVLMVDFPSLSPLAFPVSVCLSSMSWTPRLVVCHWMICLSVIFSGTLHSAGRRALYHTAYRSRISWTLLHPPWLTKLQNYGSNKIAGLTEMLCARWLSGSDCRAKSYCPDVSTTGKGLTACASSSVTCAVTSRTGFLLLVP